MLKILLFIPMIAGVFAAADCELYAFKVTPKCGSTPFLIEKTRHNLRLVQSSEEHPNGHDYLLVYERKHLFHQVINPNRTNPSDIIVAFAFAMERHSVISRLKDIGCWEEVDCGLSLKEVKNVLEKDWVFTFDPPLQADTKSPQEGIITPTNSPLTAANLAKFNALYQ